MGKSPTVRLLLGLLITLAAVTGFSSYTLHQLNGLRKLQSQTIDLNRHDSLLLLQVQNDLNAYGFKLRDEIQPSNTGRLAAHRAEFERLRRELEESIQEEATLAPVVRKPDGRAKLLENLGNFRNLSDKVFDLSAENHEREARDLAIKLAVQRAALASNVLEYLERNNGAEEKADQKIATIYDGVERNIYAFQIATMLAIIVTSLYLIYSNRRIFGRIESLSRQRRVLAARILTVQEEVLRSVSRELHDEFGQILTAVSTMLSRAERKGVPPDSPLRTELSEVRQITYNTLERMRSLSQMLHPAVLDDYGLAKGIEWYTEVFERQTGIQTSSIIEGNPVPIKGPAAINCFRIVQEALNNAAKHSGTKRAEVAMYFASDTLTIDIKDFGQGMPPAKKNDQPGLGLIAMRERAELLNGRLTVTSTPDSGTTVSLTMPLKPEENVSDTAEREESLDEVVNS